MREKIQRFMSGRYGMDSFNKFLLGATLALCIFNMFIDNRLFSLLTGVLLVYIYIRMFSRDFGKRTQENARFMEYKNKLTGKFHSHQQNMADRKTNHIYTCPNCKQKIRIPKGKGRICISCPKCHTQFERKS
ncbi:MAG: hypothetical protein RR869_00880 [Lachnospiraceae bacterium]